MTFFTDILKGIMIGIANIIPGVSGGTMAVSLGIYDKLIGSVSNLLKDWRSSVRTLLPLLIGCGIGNEQASRKVRPYTRNSNC